MEYSSVYDWIAKKSIRVVRQRQQNYFVEADVAASIDRPSLRPGQLGLVLTDFARLPVGGEALICLTVSGLRKLYKSTSGVLDIDGGVPLADVNGASFANLKSDLIDPDEPDLGYESPIHKALTPYLPHLVNPNHAILVTPALAEILLEGNLQNRPRRSRNFKKLCAQLRSGNWKVNGATITVSRFWKLLDGQHRLYAIVETGIPALCIIGFGFDPDVFDTLDQGAKRTNADTLSVAGFANTRLLASVVGVYQAVRSGSVVSNKGRALEPEECVRFVRDTPHLHEAVKLAKSYYRQGARFVSDALIGGLMARGMEIDKRTASRFFDYLLNDNCKGVRPATIQAVRKKLLRDYMDKTRSSSGAFVAALIIKAWNACRSGKVLKTVNFTPETTVDGITTGEQYPVME